MTIPNFNYIIEPISSQHNRDNFHCGIEALDYYLKKQAKQDVRRFLTAVFDKKQKLLSLKLSQKKESTVIASSF